MAKKTGLPKKYAKMGFKRGWRAYKASLRGRRSPTIRAKSPIRRRRKYSMAKRKKSYGRRAKMSLMSKTAIDGYMAQGGKFLVRKVIGGGPIFEAAIDVGLGVFRNNNTLLAQGIVEGVTAFLPSLNLGSGTTGGVR